MMVVNVNTIYMHILLEQILLGLSTAWDTLKKVVENITGDSSSANRCCAKIKYKLSR